MVGDDARLTPDIGGFAGRYLTAPTTYLSAADPKVFGDRETVLVDQSTGRSYTPDDYARLPDLTVGQVAGPPSITITRDGDGNQEDLTNEATRVWQGTSCCSYRLDDNPGVDHFSLPANENVLTRLLADLGVRS
ncbi:hypothetical protein QRX50_18585 [Amycolatopsis carbonis]|uniref:Uncharacterized protein n=1 Tax=Amycolatopsis carbonis TaxID=715471 RepID=A0A9Y2IP04_9PSEU|nr:hypothetical protein [Amycolatopsis sp. 2-15]WIX82635.1 hypothetical protein QRX50_18585 [Amycolatopsis sp. 2-15]